MAHTPVAGVVSKIQVDDGPVLPVPLCLVEYPEFREYDGYED